MCYWMMTQDGQYSSRVSRRIIASLRIDLKPVASFAEQGADTTMVQRSSTFVVYVHPHPPSFSPSNNPPRTSESILKFGLEPLYMENGPSTEDADLLFASVPNKLNEAGRVLISATKRAELYDMQILAVDITKACAQVDKKILDGLTKAGFKTNEGEGRGGFLMSVSHPPSARHPIFYD